MPPAEAKRQSGILWLSPLGAMTTKNNLCTNFSLKLLMMIYQNWLSNIQLLLSEKKKHQQISLEANSQNEDNDARMTSAHQLFSNR